MIDADAIQDLRRAFAAALDRDDPVGARSELVKVGWLDALELDEEVAVALVFREQGRTGRDVGALDDVLIQHLAAELPLHAEGLAIAHPVAPASEDPARPSHVVLAGRRPVVRILWISDLNADSLSIVDLADPLPESTLRGIDPDAGWVGLGARPDGAATELGGPEVKPLWESALAAGRVALAHQLLAGSRELLRAATAHAKERKQFGSPIAGFQAVKHRLADALVAISAGDAAVVAASATRSASGAAVAKVLAGRAAAVASRNCLQVFGGIGFTTEHEFHRYFCRNLILDRLLGDRHALERELGARIRSGGLGGERVVELVDEPRLDVL